jgi:hypothetical protein
MPALSRPDRPLVRSARPGAVRAQAVIDRLDRRGLWRDKAGDPAGTGAFDPQLVITTRKSMDYGGQMRKVATRLLSSVDMRASSVVACWVSVTPWLVIWAASATPVMF